MEIKIFYSWQSDTPPKYNRNFIEEALTKALRKIKKEPKYQFNEIVIDRDTKNTPGTPSIPETLERKISESNIFVADLTITHFPSFILKFIPKWFINVFWGRDYYYQVVNRGYNFNPSVLFELGQAFPALTDARVICVMNSFFGKPASLPFDLLQKRWPISYNYSSKTNKTKKEILEEFSNDLARAIKAVIDDGLTNPILKNYPFLDWDQWRKEFPTEIEFFPTEKLVNHIGTIQKVAGEERSLLRIVGLSGLGKTRLVFESFNPPKEAGDKELWKKVLYLNLSTCESDYLKIIRQLAESDQNKILIIDNCDSKTHQDLMPIIQMEGSHLSLITIDYNPIEFAYERSKEFDLIEIDPLDYDEVIDNILMHFFPDKNEEGERETIKNFAKGHTLIASLLAVNKKDSRGTWIPLLTRSDIINKLLGKVGENDESRKMLIAIAIFNKVGHFEDLKVQSDFIATNKLITQLDLSKELAIIKFDEVCQHYLRRGLLEKQARYVIIRIKPLALILGVEWWKGCTPEHAKKVLSSLEKQVELKEALCDQLKYLDFLEGAKEIIKDFCDSTGPFGNAEVLNTEEGSRLFRSFVEVNPQATCDALYRIFGTMTKEELFNIDAGRRNLVWALEKLCFRKETFENAIKVLLAFGVAENEPRISNNSRGQFFQLFQAFLPGTQASLKDRISIIEYALNKRDPDYEEMAIGALLRGIHTGSFTRMGGPDIQGSSAPLIDYRPQFGELSDYWRFCLEKLFEIGTTNKKKKDTIFSSIINSTRGLYKERCGHLIFPILKMITEQDQDSWFNIRTNLRMTLKFEGSYLSPEEKLEISSLAKELEPSDFITKYKNYVKISYWDYSEESESIMEVTNQRAFDLADQFINEKLPYDKYMPLFFDGEQHLGYFFGRRLGELLRDTENNTDFALVAIEAVKSIPAERRNLAVYAGFLYNQTNEDTKLALFNNIVEDVDLKTLAFYLASMINPTFKIINLLFNLVNNKTNKVTEFKKFQFGHSLDRLTEKEIIQFGETLIDNYGKEGSQTALSVLFAYSWSNEEKWEIVANTIRKALMTKGLLVWEEPDMFDKSNWGESIIKLLHKSKDPDLVNFITIEIIQFCSTDQFVGSFDYDLKKVLQIFLDEYFEIIWPDLGKALLSEKENYITYYNLHNILGSHIGSIGTDIGILFNNNLDKLYEWAKKERGIAPARLALMTPIYDYAEGNVLQSSWYPFTKKLIDEFGDDDGFLEDLSANMGTYSWTGSVVPLLHAEKQIMEALTTHKFERVRNWALGKLKHIDRAIRQESNLDVERYL